MRSWHNIIKYLAIVFAIMLVIGILGGIIRILSFISPAFASGVSKDYKTYAIENDIHILDIDIQEANLELEATSDSKIRVESNYKHLTVTEKGDKLLIKDKKSFFSNTGGKAVVKLFIPHNNVFDEVEISTGAGSLNIEKLEANSIDMDFGAGKALLKNILARNHASLDSGLGELIIKDSEFTNLDLDMGVGQLDFSGSLSGRNSFRMGVGSSQFKFRGSLDDYALDIKKGLGEIRVGRENIDSDTELGRGDRKIYIEGAVGSVKIDFSE